MGNTGPHLSLPQRGASPLSPTAAAFSLLWAFHPLWRPRIMVQLGHREPLCELQRVPFAPEDAAPRQWDGCVSRVPTQPRG